MGRSMTKEMSLESYLELCAELYELQKEDSE